ncbi:MAG TPA: hypothetical protein VGA09_21020, partial [Candidatus Binatia bacterium]
MPRRGAKIIRLKLRFLVPGAIGLFLTAPYASFPADKIRVATGGYSPSIPPYFTYAVPFLQKQDIEIE